MVTAGFRFGPRKLSFRRAVNKKTMKQLEKQVNRLLKTVEQDNEILAIFLFGSIARDNYYKGSDVDICLVMRPGFYTSLALSEKKLSYLNLFDMDIQIFQQLPLYIRIRVIKEGKILHCKDEDQLYEIAFRTIREFGDFEHVYRDYLKEVLSGR